MQTGEQLNIFFAIQAQLSDQKLTITIKDLNAGIVYQKEFTQNHIGKEINHLMTLQNIFETINLGKEGNNCSQSVLNNKGSFTFYTNLYYGQIFKHKDLKCFKVDRHGVLTVYLSLFDKRNDKQMLFQSTLNLNKKKQISELQKNNQWLTCQVISLKQSMSSQAEQHRNSTLQLKTKLSEMQKNYQMLALKVQNIQHTIEANKNLISSKSMLDWDIFVYPRPGQQSSAKIFNQEFRCAIGKNGASAWKKEGDGKSPVGTFRLREIWARTDRISKDIYNILLDTGLPVYKINEYDGWCDQPTSSSYNKHVDLRVFDNKISHENLWRQDNLYDWFIVVGYNDNPIIPGKGSAIFMHIARQNYSGTAGCIAFSKTDLESVTKMLRAYTVITIYDESAIMNKF